MLAVVPCQFDTLNACILTGKKFNHVPGIISPTVFDQYELEGYVDRFEGCDDAAMQLN